MIVLRKLCLLPPVNLVSNLGVDKVATHTSFEEWPLLLPTHSITPKHPAGSRNKEMCPADYDHLLEQNLFNIRKFRLLKLLAGTIIDFFKKPSRSLLLERIKA